MPPKRKSAAETRRSIVESTTTLIRQGGVQALTVSSIMYHAGIFRTAFYRQFTDVHEVIAEILESATTELMMGAGPWLTDTDTHGTPETITAALLSFANAFHANGDLLSALADASRTDDRLHRMWRYGLIEAFNSAVSRAIAQDQAAGFVRPDIDPIRTALGLNLMDEGVSIELLGGQGDGTPEDFVAIVGPIWTHTLFGSVPGAGRTD